MLRLLNWLARHGRKQKHHQVVWIGKGRPNRLGCAVLEKIDKPGWDTMYHHPGHAVNGVLRILKEFGDSTSIYVCAEREDAQIRFALQRADIPKFCLISPAAAGSQHNNTVADILVAQNGVLQPHPLSPVHHTPTWRNRLSDIFRGAQYAR